MRSFKAVLAAASVLVLMGVATSAGAANLLVNGGFEDVSGAAFQSWGGYTFGAGYSTLPGWTVDFGSVDVTTNGSGWSPAAEGQNSLDINGWEAGQISQGFDDVAGQTYTVTFDYSRNAAGAPDPATADVTVGGQVAHISSPYDPAEFGTFGAMLWKTDSFTFVGSGHDSISLTATVPGNGGVFFDDIRISAGVPEPATWGLMILGFGGAGALLRHRRRAMLAAAA